MAQEIDLAQPSTNGSELPAFVRVGSSPRMSANEIRALKAATGRTLTSLMEDETDAMQAMAWLALYRSGHAATWEQAGEIPIDMGAEAPDPMSAAISIPSPGSVDSGGSLPETLTQ